MDNERQRSGWSADGPRGRLATPFDSNFTGVGQLLPSRLVRIQHLPWLSLWESQLRAEKKSNHTIRAYLSAARRFGMTLLPGEEDDEAVRICNKLISKGAIAAGISGSDRKSVV